MHQNSSAKNLSENLRNLRKQKNLSLKQLAKISNIPASTLEKIESQTLKKLKFQHLEKLCKTFSVNVNKLL